MERDAGAEQAHQQEEAIAAFERSEPSSINMQRTASCKRGAERAKEIAVAAGIAGDACRFEQL